MNFEEYLQYALNEDPELKREFDALQPEYEIMEKLIKARAEANLTQRELAQKCGVKQSNISRLESGKGNPTLKFLKRVADSLECDLVIEFRKREPVTETSAAESSLVSEPIQHSEQYITPKVSADLIPQKMEVIVNV